MVALVFIGWILCMYWTQYVVVARGHSRYLGLVLGLLLGPLGVIIAYRLPPTGGRTVYLMVGAFVTVAGLAAVIFTLSLLSSSISMLGLLIMALVVVTVGIGLIYRGVKGEEVRLPEEIANPVTETMLEATAKGLLQGPGEAVISVARNIPAIYRSLKNGTEKSPDRKGQSIGDGTD